MGQSTPSPDKRRALRRAEDRHRLVLERELDAARRVSEILFQVRHPDEVISRALEISVEVLDAEGGSILIANPATRELVFRHSIGIKPAKVGMAIPWDKGIAGAVYHGGEAAIIHDVQGDARHFKGIDAVTTFVTQNMITAPLKRWKASTIGVLEIVNKRGGRFDELDLSLVTIVSTISAAAIERAQLDEEAKLAAVARLVAGIGHDIKNLLTPVVFGSEILSISLDELYQKLPAEERERALKTYQRCGNILTAAKASSRRIQDRLKEISDCVRGRSMPPRFAPCAVAAVVDQVFASLGVISQQLGIALRADGLERLPEISADEGKLFNLFYNLVNNALAEVPGGGSVTVRGEPAPAGDGVLVDVADTGRGMPPEVRDQLFTDAVATSHKRYGSGLGTRLAKDVVDAHGGRIAVDSTVGVGTTIKIFLPLAPAAA